MAKTSNKMAMFFNLVLLISLLLIMSMAEARLFGVMMIYKTFNVESKVEKLIQMVLHLIAISRGIVGIYSVFKFHKENNISDKHSIDSWMGNVSFCSYVVQWLFRFVITFFFPGGAEVHTEDMSMFHLVLHKLACIFTFLMAISMAWLLEKFYSGCWKRSSPY